MSAGTVVLILAGLLGIQPITTDLYLPALPTLTADLGAGMTQAQLTLTALLLAFGVSQMAWGPLSDRFGRRPILLLGLSTYIVAAIGSALAPSMDMLVIWRTLQGVAMGASVMGARAIIRDLYDPSEGAQVMSKALSGLAVIACLSAPIGGLLTDLFSWRAALLVLAVFAAASLMLVAMRFQESLVHVKPQALAPRALVRSWGHIAGNRTFVAWSAISSASYGGLFTFLASSSFVFIQVLSLSKTAYGMLMFSVSFSYLMGTFLCRRLLIKLGVRGAVAVASAMTLTAGTSMGLFALAGWSSGPNGKWFIIVPMYLFMMAHGVHQPCGQSGAVGPFPHMAGTASALNGFMMMVVAFAMGGWLGWRMDGTVFALTNGIWFWSVLIALAGWTLVQKHGVPRPVAPPHD